MAGGRVLRHLFTGCSRQRVIPLTHYRRPPTWWGVAFIFIENTGFSHIFPLFPLDERGKIWYGISRYNSSSSDRKVWREATQRYWENLKVATLPPFPAHWTERSVKTAVSLYCRGVREADAVGSCVGGAKRRRVRSAGKSSRLVGEAARGNSCVANGGAEALTPGVATRTAKEDLRQVS